MLTFYEPESETIPLEKFIGDIIVRVSNQSLQLMKNHLDHKLVKFYIMKNVLDMKRSKRKGYASY
jgi:hypothetical protein